MYRGARRTLARFITRSRRLVPGIVGAAVLASAVAVSPAPVAAAGPKVVIVVGPTHSATATYISRAKVIASQARSLGATVTEIYTPHATWSRVKAAAQGANLFVYLGHGNGWPSPYAPFTTDTKDGLGLNPIDGSGTTSPVKYYGEGMIASEIRFAPNAVVLLNHLCYASGSSEPGHAEPTWDVARQRVDNYAAGFLAAGAGAVIADAYRDVSYDVKVLLGPNRNLLDAWKADPQANGHVRAFASARRAGFTNYLDPETKSSDFSRALTTKPTFTTRPPTFAPLTAKTTTSVILRSKPAESGSKVATLATATTVRVIGPLASDGKGRTWAPVQTSSGKKGWIAAWLASFGGSAVPTTNVILRSSPSTSGAKVATVTKGTRVYVTGSRRDAQLRVWLSVKTTTGKTGWMAAWLMRN